MKTRKSLKFSKETVVVLNNKSKQTIIGGQANGSFACAEINNLAAMSVYKQCLG